MRYRVYGYYLQQDPMDQQHITDIRTYRYFWVGATVEIQRLKPCSTRAAEIGRKVVSNMKNLFALQIRDPVLGLFVSAVKNSFI
jgi:hypothetical protein